VAAAAAADIDKRSFRTPMTLRGKTITRMAAILIGAVLVCSASVAVGWADPASSACLSGSGEAAVTACRQELRHDPDNVASRLALSDALMALEKYQEAVAVLREGAMRDPGDEAIKKKLTLAQSYLEEQQWIEKRNQRKQSMNLTKNADTRTRLSLIRCTTLKGEAALTACNEGLAVAPHNADLLTGRGNVWLGKDRIVDAIADFKAALAADPGNRDAADGLRLAGVKRKIKVTQCLQFDDRDGLAACDAALEKGAPDAFAIQKRRAELLHAMHREKEAIAAYRTAARLHPKDTEVKNALAALTAPAEIPTPPKAAGRKASITKPSRSSTPTAPKKSGKISSTKPAAAPKPSLKTAANDSGHATAASDRDDQLVQGVKPSVAETVSHPPPSKIEVSQVHRFSNAPEAPGITH
jgi:tetratricopeptide (TPR) repeat protein